MRRKSTRNAQKATPDKTVKETEITPKTRRLRRRKRSPSKSSESEEEVLAAKRSSPEETPDTTTKSHTPSDEETSEEPIWKVTPTEEEPPKGEIQKLKICLTRPSPDSPDKSKSRRSKSNSQTEDDSATSEDKPTRRTRSRGSPIVRNDGISSQEGDEDDHVEEKKGKGKSKGKHKSKIEKSSQLSEPEIKTNNEISENVQVTPQSPTINKPVDNENDYNKADPDDKQNVNEIIEKNESVSEESSNNVAHDSNNIQADEVADKRDNKESDDDDDQPLSVIQKNSTENNITSQSIDESSEVAPEVQKEKNDSDDEKVVEESTPATQEVVTEIQESASPNDKKNEDSSEENVKKPVSSENNEVSSLNEIEVKETEETMVEKKAPTKAETEITKIENEKEKTTEEHKVHEVSEDDTTIINANISPDNMSETENSLNEATNEEIPSSNKSDDSVTKGINSSTEATNSSPTKTTVSSPLETSEVKQESSTAHSPRRWLKRHNNYSKDHSEEGETSNVNSSIKPTKSKRKWDNTTPEETSPLVKVDLESIQVVWSSIDFPEEPDLSLDVAKERRKSISDLASKKIERKVSVDYKSDISDRPSFEKQSSVSSTNQDSEDNSNIIAFNRKISIVDDTASKLKPPPSPAKNPVSNILYITNLVRPFTVKQLKELLERTGKIVEEGFWTDRIKSKCYVQYETQDEAEATRNALHGVQWPIGNGKKLIIDYATEEDMSNAKNPPTPQPAVPVQETKIAVKENEPVESNAKDEEKPPKELERKRSVGPIREWDIGKKDVRRDRSRSRERSRKHKRSPSPSDDFISRKQRKEEESVPQKLMDDLFLKTKTTPSIYWQPLSPEEIAMKQQQRLMRMEEHKRRMEENSRMKAREVGRGAFRRRYD